VPWSLSLFVVHRHVDGDLGVVGHRVDKESFLTMRKRMVAVVKGKTEVFGHRVHYH